jgi:hypothetical protein
MSIDDLFEMRYDIPKSTVPLHSTHGSELYEALDWGKRFEHPIVQWDCRWFNESYFSNSQSIIVDILDLKTHNISYESTLMLSHDGFWKTGKLLINLWNNDERKEVVSMWDYAFRQTNYD